jgi:hypothetical protein
MPNLTKHLVPVCRSNFDWSRTVLSTSDFSKEYKVVYCEQFDENKPRYDYSCTCPSYVYGNGKHCKHINFVKYNRCVWNSEMEHRETPQDGCCPECGNELMFVEAAV